MGEIDIAFRKPVYKENKLAFPSAPDLYSRTCGAYAWQRRELSSFRMQSMKHVKQKKSISSIEFDPAFEYLIFQRDIFRLIDPVEERLREVDLKEGVSGSAVLGYSTMPVLDGNKLVRNLYPIAFRIELKYKDDVTGELERNGVIAVAPIGSGFVAIVTEGVNHTGDNLLTGLRRFIREESKKLFGDCVEEDMEPGYSGSVPDFLAAKKGLFAYWEAHDIKLLEAAPG